MESAGFLIAPSLLGLLGVLVAFFAHYEKKIKALQSHLLEAKEKIAQKDNQKASPIKDLKKQLEQKEKENASLIKANEEIAQKENEKALLVRDLQNQLEQKDNENASLIKAKQKIGQKAFEKALLVRDLQNQLEQKDNENAFLIKAKQKIAQKEYEKALLVRDLQNQLEQKDNENSSLIKAKEEIAQKEYEKALLVRDLQKQLARTEKEFVQKANEHASLVGDFEKELAQQVNDELAQRIYSQPQVDGETWQFQGDSGEWVSFPDYANKVLMVQLGEGHEMCDIVIDGKTYEIDFKKSSQMNQRTKKERRIRCFFDLPSHWQMTNLDAMKLLKESLLPQDGVQQSLWQRLLRLRHHGRSAKRSPTFVQPLFPVTDQDVKLRLGELLNKSLSRHDGSHCTCLHGSSNFVVTEAYQVNNLPLWRRYQRFVRSMQDKHKQHGISLEEINPSVSEALTDFAKHLNVDLTGNERLVVHGTQKFELARAIATEGFDNRVARNGNGLYGKGTYFAAQTCKSAQYATEDGRKSKASPQMMGTMLIARVAIGDPYYTPRGCADLSRPPEKNGVLADSIIARPGIPNGQPGGVQSHMEVVTFDPAQAYPEFIVRFTEE